MSTLSIQKSIRDNAEECQDYLRDLNNWIKDIKIQDNLCQTKGKSEMDKELQSESAGERKQPIQECKPVVSGNAASKEKADRYKSEGNKYYANGRYSDAVAKYTQGLAVDPLNHLLYANRAMAYIKLEKFGAAEKDCTKAMEIDSTYVKSYLRRATARFHLQKLQGAIEDYQKVSDFEPWNKEAKMEINKIEKIISNKTNGENTKLNSRNEATDSKIYTSKKAEIRSQTSRPSDSKGSEDTSETAGKDTDEREGKKIKLDTHSLSNASSQKEKKFASRSPLVNVSIVEVNTREEMDKLLNKENSSDITVPATAQVKTKPQITQTSISKQVSETRQDEVCPALVQETPPALPRIPKTSHQFSQSWLKLRKHDELRMEYLKIIPTLFFSRTEIEADLVPEIASCLINPKVEDKTAAEIVVALTKSQGFYLNLTFLDQKQKKVLEDVLKKIENFKDLPEIELLKQRLKT